MSADSNIYFQVTRGKLKDKVFKVHQICNDWVTLDEIDGGHANGGQPLGLGSCYFDLYNRVKIYELARDKKVGSMFMYFSLEHFMQTGKFKRNK